MAKKKISKLKSGLFSRSISLARAGLQAGAMAASKSVGDLFSNEAAKEIREKAHLISQLGAMAEEFGELKGSIMKVGQMLSMYGEHFLPPEANALLRTLHSSAPPLEWKEIKKCLNRNLGKEKMALLAVEEESLACASLGQVHRARILSSKKEIVLKIQYPGVDGAIESDIRALRSFLSISKLFKLPEPDALFDEIKNMLYLELDYIREKKELDFFYQELQGDARYIIPLSIPEFSTKRVLAMSYEPGVALDSAELAALPQSTRNNLAEALVHLYARELYQYRKVQTDPHFGNFRIRIEGDKASWVLYDYGAVREFPPQFMDNHRKMLKGLIFNDRSEFYQAAEKFGILREGDTDEIKEKFHDFCALFLEPFLEDKPYDWAGSDLPKRAAAATRELIKTFPMRAPPQEVIFLDRKMIGIFTCLAILRAKINVRKIFMKYI